MTDEPRVGGRVLAIVAGALPILLGLTALWLAHDLGVGTLTAPGAGLWPTVVAGLLVFTGAAIVLTSRDADDTEAFTGQTWAVVAAAATLGVYAYLLERIGFEIPTVAVLVVWIRWLGRVGWRTTVLTAVLATVGTYLLFITVLDVPLPHLVAI